MQEDSLFKNPMTLIFAGPQGSGKGTQVGLLKDFLQKQGGKDSVFQAEVGGHFRTLLKEQTTTANRVRATIDKGDLQPEFLASYMWSREIVEKIDDTKHFFLDGSPRTILEAKIFDTAMNFYDRSPVVIMFDVKKEEVLKRLVARGRNDDTEKAIEHRLDQYYKITVPAFDYLRKIDRYTFISINGEQDMNSVHNDILLALKLT